LLLEGPVRLFLHTHQAPAFGPGEQGVGIGDLPVGLGVAVADALAVGEWIGFLAVAHFASIHQALEVVRQPGLEPGDLGLVLGLLGVAPGLELGDLLRYLAPARLDSSTR
jgi:hypothetical protein